MSCSMSNSVWDSNGITIAGQQGELSEPYAVVMSKNTSSLFITDTLRNRVVEYDLNSQTYIRIYDRADTGQDLVVPIALALSDDDSQLLVACFPQKYIFRWLFPSYSSKLIVASYYTGYIGVAIDRNKTVYASEHMTDAISSYDTSIGPYWNYGDWVFKPSYAARHILIINNDMYIVQTQLCRVIKVSLTDENQRVTVVAGIGRIGSTSDRLRFPWGLAVDPTEGHVFVSDSRNHRVQLCINSHIST